MVQTRVELYVQDIDKDVAMNVHWEWQEIEPQKLYYPGVGTAGYLIDEIELDTEDLTNDEIIYIDSILDTKEMYDKIVEQLNKAAEI